MHFGLASRSVEYIAGAFSTTVGDLLRHVLILRDSKWSCLLFRIALQDALKEVLKVHPLLKLKVDDMKLHVWFKKSCKAGARVVCKLKSWIQKHKIEVIFDIKRERRQEQPCCVAQVP